MSDIDTRLKEMSALLDDVRCSAADIEEEVTCEPLTDVRRYVNWALSAVERAGALLQIGGDCGEHNVLPIVR